MTPEARAYTHGSAQENKIMFSDLIKSKKSPSQARIDQLLKELFSADSEREDEDGDEMDKGGA